MPSRHNRCLFVAASAVLMFALHGCGEGGGTEPSSDTGADTGADTTADTADDASDTGTGDDADAPDSGDTADTTDTEVPDTQDDGDAAEAGDTADDTVDDSSDGDGDGTDTTDPCVGRATCEETAWCDGDDAVVCTVDDDGCLVETGRETCGFGCAAGDCEASPCEAMPCIVGEDEPYCDADVYVACALDVALSCHHWTRVDCTETDGFVCVDTGFEVGCEEETCGDGFADGFVGEECDDGNRDDGDGCSAVCEIEDGGICLSGPGGLSICQLPACGNDAVEFGEECDGVGPGSGCSAECQVEGGFVCTGSPSTCVTPVCGDGTADRGEGCDDGGTDGMDGCSETCGAEIDSVGGSVVHFSGALAYGDPLFSRPDISCAEIAGASHPYDHVRIANPHASSVSVDIEAVFSGEGAMFVFEVPFDPADAASACVEGSNSHPRYGRLGARIAALTLPAGSEYVVLVTTSAQRIPIGGYTIDVTTRGCGDGLVGSGEECDDGNHEAGDGCNASCLLEGGWECVDEPSYCHVPGCGGGLVEDGEECDDGNAVPDDGCTACAIDGGAECVGDRPSVCRFPGCGDGWLDFGEECDDDDGDDGDGCDAECLVEDGWVCDGEPSVCVEIVCGNGTVTPPYESCDDGNTDGGDGCSAACAIELAAAGASVGATGSSEATDPVFVRASEACGASSVLTYYDQLTVVNPGPTAVRLTVTANWTGDGFLHLYDTFDGASPTAGCLDGAPAAGGTSEVSAIIPAGDTATIVVSSISSFSAHGAWTLTMASSAP